MKHAYAEILYAIAEGKQIQWKGLHGWCNNHSFEVLGDIANQVFRPEEYRIKPSTILIAGMEVPAPRAAAPALGSHYWLLSVGDEEATARYTWDGGPTDQRILAAGQCWDNEADAAIAAAAIALLFTGG